MAVDANILLQQRGIDLAPAVDAFNRSKQQRIQNERQAAQDQLNNQLLNLQMQGIEQQQQARQQEQVIKDGGFLGSTILGHLNNGQPDLAAQFLQSQMPYLTGASKQMAQEALDMISTNDPNELERLKQLSGMAVNSAQQFGLMQMSAQDRASVQFGASARFKDEAGNYFDQTTRRNPATGQIESVLVPTNPNQEAKQPVGAITEVSSGGLTPQERVSQKASESGATEQAKIQAKERTEVIRQGRAASDQLFKINKMIDLNRKISTGKVAGIGKAMSDFFGVTNADVGQFNSLAGQLVLDQIRLLGANPTEGERAYLQQITPSLQQGGAVNEAILMNLKEIAQRQKQRASRLVENKGLTLDELFFEESDFSPASQQSQQQASDSQNVVNWSDL